MRTPIDELTDIARKLHGRLSLEEILQTVADGAARLLAAPRTSLRLLDPTRTRLIAVCRAGAPLHRDPTSEFRLGEGLIGWIAEHGRPLRTGEADRDPRFVPRPDMKQRMGSFLGVPLMAGASCMGVLSAVHPSPDHFDEEHEQHALLLAAMAAPHLEIARLAGLTRVDGLTGTLNRRGLDATFPEVAGPPDDDGLIRPLCVAMADIDHFKRVNDEYGHAVGDEVLKAVSNRLVGVVRGGDAVVRYGGEEFLLILPSVALAAGARVAERARAAVAEQAVVAAGTSLPVTISLGVAERRAGESRHELIARADAAMYAAKRAGRNRVEVAEP
jgi:diguanylate cyclase (GGDEF)-like protein